jgi:hypothetical protein
LTVTAGDVDTYVKVSLLRRLDTCPTQIDAPDQDLFAPGRPTREGTNLKASFGLLSIGIAVLVEPPPGSRFSRATLGSLLLVAAVIVGVVVPLRTSITYGSRTKLLTGIRIDCLKNGEWERDSKVAVLRTIEQDKAALVKRLNDLNSLFLALLVLLVASDIDWLILTTAYIL